MQEHIEALVENSFLFKSLDDSGRQMLLKIGVDIHFDPGTEIISEGATDKSFFFIKTGKVAVKTIATGRDVVLAHLGAGAIFGEISYLSSQPRTASVFAESGVDVIMFSKEKVDGILKRYPSVIKLMQKVKEGRTQDKARKVEGGEV